MAKRKRQPLSMTQSATSAMFGGVCNVIAGQPFDTIKVRLQTQGTREKKLYAGPFDCFSKMVRKEGMFSLYKGTSGAFASIMTENVVLLTANTGIKAMYRKYCMRGTDRALNFSEHALCGGLAGIFSAVAITPAEVVKVRLQVSRGKCAAKGDVHQYKGPIDCVRKTVRAEGIPGLFRGLNSVLARDLPFNCVFLSSYEVIIHGMLSFRGGGADKAALASKDQLSSLEILLAGGFAGTIGWAVIFPVDVLKSRLQTSKIKNQGMLSVARRILATEGIGAFYLGCSAALLRAFPANAGLFFGYEMAQRMLFR